MGLYEREYYHGERRFRIGLPMGPRWRTSAVAWLIGITVGAHFLQLILQSAGLPPVLDCVPSKVVGEFQIWRLLTAAFCHADLGHLFFNMLCLFFFGPQIEGLYGRRDFTVFYLAAAVIGNLAFTAAAYASGNIHQPVIGASGACYAVLVLCAFYFPRQIVLLLIIPMPLWFLSACFVLKDVIALLNPHADPLVAYVVHLAGAATGALHRLFDLRAGTLLARVARARARRRWRRTFQERIKTDDGVPRDIEELEQRRLDRLLGKIHESGRESLSAEELAFLDRMSQRYRRRT